MSATAVAIPVKQTMRFALAESRSNRMNMAQKQPQPTI